MRYTIDTKPHGSGGFGKIIRGHDNDLDRDVAVKVLSGLKEGFTPADTERFRREARILAKLSHPNIPAIYDVVFDDADASFLIVFQFVEGHNLRQVLNNEGACQLSEVRNWFHQIASALEYAHSKEVIHRDVKPENIIITPDRETAYLVDFGIALSAEDSKKLTEYGYAIGTPGYMSPEQMAGKELDGRTDVYTLGVNLYEALAGKAIPVGDYEELSNTNESIPPQVDQLIQECLLPLERRVPSAKSFSIRLAGSLRITKPLSEILAHGRLHEVAAALEELDAEQFSRLPPGQQTLVLVKCDDIVTSNEENLKLAAARFLELLVSLGLLLSKDDYQGIVKPAIYWAFEQHFEGKQGNVPLQRALERAASEARENAHAVLSIEILSFLNSVQLEGKPNWYLQVLRNLLTTLMANQACLINIKELSGYLKEVNRIQRAKG